MLANAESRNMHWFIGIKAIQLNILSFVFLGVLIQDLLHREERVLQFWTLKKKRLDQREQFVTFQKSAQITLDWVLEEGA